jgi:Asp-tRNA(Asn)/Glu-tRNA(Gln) amidotransferase B subunit
LTDSEVRRQIGELEAGGVIEQATRGFDEITNETFHLRGKADAPDYRYMPDPELGSIIVDQVCRHTDSILFSFPTNLNVRCSIYSTRCKLLFLNYQSMHSIGYRVNMV